LYWVIPVIGFVVANIKLFGELESEKTGLQKQIDEFEDTSARILLEVTETEFSHSYGSRRSPFRGIQSNPRGFDKQGIPDWGVFWARLRISNIGYDSGTLVVKIDETNTKLPVFFDQQSFHLEFYAPANLAGRTEHTEDLYYDVLFAEKEPQTFAQSLKYLVKSNGRYKIVLRYLTKRIDGNSETQELIIEGDFRYLHQKITEYWRGFYHNELADLARLDND
jgi:hypothetical protein